MTKVVLSAELERVLDEVLGDDCSDFLQIATKLGLDPARSFRGGDLRRVDFGTAELSAFDFSRADLEGAVRLIDKESLDTKHAARTSSVKTGPFIGAGQTTLGRAIELSGIGVHSGAPVSMVLHPAEADTGYRFLVTKRGRILAEIPGHVDHVKNLTLCTVLGDESGVTIGTVEHLLAALRGLSIDNCYIEVDAREVPIMDGSAAAFVAAVDGVGIRELLRPRKFLKVLKPIRVDERGSWGELRPHSSFRLDVEIDFETPLIGKQRYALEMNTGAFRNEVARAREFGFMRDVEALWDAGLALGASLDNTIALAEDRIMNPEGLRYPQEFVRHKMLDAIGDLALAGAPILGAYQSVRGGHRLNVSVLRKLLADVDAWTIVSAPRTREVVSVDASITLGIPKFADLSG
jgi:UDP-3-O-[3-hydroxymyristoyl] N-acetylglucosamine deacetylase